MIEHLLHLEIGESWHRFTVTCEHPIPDPAWHTVPFEGEGEESEDCWVPDWVEVLVADEYLGGTWPKEISFPCPVRCEWTGDGILVHYAGPS